MRSVVVVLPASMCAMIPKLRYIDRSTSRLVLVAVFIEAEARGCAVTAGRERPGA